MTRCANRVILRCGNCQQLPAYVKADAPGRQRTFSRGSPPPLERNALFERQNDRTRNWIGDTKSPTNVFESNPERNQGCHQVPARLCERFHVRQFSNDAIAVVPIFIMWACL